MKNKLLFDLTVKVLTGSFAVLSLADVKQSDLPEVIAYLRAQTAKLGIDPDRIVHWDVTDVAMLTAHTTELHRMVLLLGKEVNRIRVGQKQVIKNFIKEAQRADEMIVLQKKRKEVSDAYEGSKD